MKKLVLLIMLVLPMAAFADKKKTRIDSIQIVRDSILLAEIQLLEQIEMDLSLKNRYKMYPTENMYNFLELDTKTGIIKQVQWAMKREDETIFPINTEDLTSNYCFGPGTFELYPTKNIYQFVLLDKTDGRVWHVQWGLEEEHRWIRRIK